MSEIDLAKRIVQELNKLDNNSKTIDKIGFDYVDTQVIVVLRCLQENNRSGDVNDCYGVNE